MYQEKTRNHVTGRVLTRLLVFLQAPLVRRLLNVLVNIGSTHQLFRSVPHGHPCCGVVEKDPIIARPHYTPDESRHRYLDSWRSSKRISVYVKGHLTWAVRWRMYHGVPGMGLVAIGRAF